MGFNMKYENVFNEVAKQYYDAIFRYCCVKLKDEHAAQDCTQEVFYTFLNKINKLRLSENIRAWLYRTADNVMKNYKKKHKEMVSYDDVNEVTEDTYSLETPFNDVISEDEYELLKSYYIDEEDIETISERLGISKAATSQRIHRIKAKIKEKYMQN